VCLSSKTIHPEPAARVFLRRHVAVVTLMHAQKCCDAAMQCRKCCKRRVAICKGVSGRYFTDKAVLAEGPSNASRIAQVRTL
jgi:hypothetical protein